MTAPTVHIDEIRAAKMLADEFAKRFTSELKRVKRAGCVLKYRMESEEQIGRGTIHVAHARIEPLDDVAKRKFKRHGADAIQARADYEDPSDSFDALKAAIDEGFTLAKDAGIFV